MANLLFDAPWWLPTLLAGLGIFLFWTGNRRQESKRPDNADWSIQVMENRRVKAGTGLRFASRQQLRESGIVRRNSFAMVFFEGKTLTGESSNIRAQEFVFVVILLPYAAAIDDENQMLGLRVCRREHGGAQGPCKKGSAIHQNFTVALNRICRESVNSVAVF